MSSDASSYRVALFRALPCLFLRQRVEANRFFALSIYCPRYLLTNFECRRVTRNREAESNPKRHSGVNKSIRTNHMDRNCLEQADYWVGLETTRALKLDTRNPMDRVLCKSMRVFVIQKSKDNNF